MRRDYAPFFISVLADVVHKFYLTDYDNDFAEFGVTYSPSLFYRKILIN